MSESSSTFDAKSFIGEHLALIGMNASMAKAFLEVGDVAGFRYSLSCMVARVKAVAGTFNDISAPAPPDERGR
jgi:hypothetical protein